MAHPAALLRMIRHIPPEQLALRAAFQARRKLRRSLADAGFDTPLSWGTRAEPLPPDRWPRLDVPDVHPRIDGALDLHGCRVALVPPVAWTPEDGFGGTDLQLVHLHEHRWIAALDDATLIAVLSDWIDRVRPYGPRYWIATWNGYTLAGRALTWMRELAVRDLPPSFVVRALASLLEQLAFLYRNLELDLRGNHLLRNLAALAWGAACFDGPDAQAWRARVLALLPRELDHQILSDGHHFERSPSYHLHVLADLLVIHGALPDSDVRERLAGVIDRMVAVGLALTHPDGLPSLFSDGGLHLAPTAGALAQAWSDRTKRPRADVPATLLLDAVGLAVHRGPEQTLIVDCGPLAADDLPAHGHADALSFEWSVGGRRVFVDAGTPLYEAGPARAACRGTAVHNTLTLDDADQAELFGSFRMGRRPSVTRTAWAARDDGFALAARHDGYRHLRGRPEHHRRFDLRGPRLVVHDRVTGGSGQRAVARLLLHPDVAVAPAEGGLDLGVGPVLISLRSRAPIRVEPSVWWPDFGVELPTRRIVLDLGEAPCDGRFELTILGAGA